MHISSLTVTNFRNITTQRFEFLRGINILFGDNGSGKTNLLEAIFVLLLGRSHRGASDNYMVRSECDVYRIEGEIITDNKSIEVAVAYQRSERKKITIDKVTSRIQELYEIFCVVSAGPEDSAILSGAPSTRRGFVDIYLSQISRKYLDDLSNYQKVLSQKNAALKNEMDPGPFNALLVTYGCRIMSNRITFLDEVASLTREFYREISGGGNLNLTYQPSIGGLEEDRSPEGLQQRFERRLSDSRHREQVMHTSLVGPHRDDIHFEIEGLPARQHASQGEWRTGAIALKLAVYQILKEKRESEPILLLDEIFAELDEKRINGLIDAFGGFGQLFLTTAVEPPSRMKENSRRFQIAGGAVEGIA